MTDNNIAVFFNNIEKNIKLEQRLQRLEREGFSTEIRFKIRDEE